MRYSIVNLGCKVNRVESDDLAVSLEKLGMEPWSRRRGGGGHAAEAPGDGLLGESTGADLVIVNTCTVTGEAEKKTRKAVRRALREHPRASVVVTGCAAAIDAEAFRALDGRVVVAGKRELAEATRQADRLMELIPPLRSGFRAMPPRVDGRGEDPISVLRVGRGFPTRVGIKIQDGCDNACTYCIVHVARGRAWSRPADEVVEEYRHYTEAGVREIVLSGINIGTYREEGLDLADLLERLLGASSEARIRISSIEPRDVSERLIDLMARSDGRIARHLHLPLQAGSSRVLREMARPYSAERYVDLVDRLYAAMPSLSLSTDIIVGFPGESDDDFAETLAMARRCRFSKIHVFPYSKREGTPAAIRSDQIPPNVKALRAAALSELGDRLRNAAYEVRRGSVERVLVETNGKGMTESYFEIDVAAELTPGELVELRLP